MVEVDGAVRIGGFVIEQPYGDEPGKVGIYRYQHGEGGNFDAAATASDATARLAAISRKIEP